MTINTMKRLTDDGGTHMNKSQIEKAMANAATCLIEK